MCDMTQTIESYRESAMKLEGRINELHRQIATAGEGEGAHLLKERRYLLYTELWDIEHSIRLMQEYVDCMRANKASA